MYSFIKILILSFFLPLLTQAQLVNDSTSTNPLRVDINTLHFGPRISVGIQSALYVDLGFSLSHFLGSPHGVYGQDLYVSGVYFPAFKSSQENVYGFKLGGSFMGNMFLLGLEGTYLSSGEKDDFLVTPKAGIGFSMLYLSYGYSISTNDYVVNRIGKHQFAITANLPFYTINKKKNLKYWGIKP